MKVWIDQDLCTGDGLCVDHCPEVFVLLDDGISYVHARGVPQNDPGGAASRTLSASFKPSRISKRPRAAGTAAQSA